MWRSCANSSPSSGRRVAPSQVGGPAAGWLVSYRLGAFAMLLPPWHVWQRTKGKSGCKCPSSLQHLGRGYIETANLRFDSSFAPLLLLPSSHSRQRLPHLRWCRSGGASLCVSGTPVSPAGPGPHPRVWRRCSGPSGLPHSAHSGRSQGAGACRWELSWFICWTMATIL